MTRFVLDGHAGYYNRGCEALVQATVWIIRETIGESRFLVIGSDAERDASLEQDERIVFEPRGAPVLSPGWFHGKFRGALKRLGLSDSAPRYVEVQHLAGEIDAADCYLHIGGDNYSLEYGFPRIWIEIGNWVMDRGRPAVLWGASITPSDRYADRMEMLVDHLRRLDLVTVREPLTLQYLAELGVTENVRRVADPAFLFQPEPIDLQRLVPGIDESAPIFGLNLSPFALRFAEGRSDQELLAETIRYARALLDDHDMQVLLVPHVTDPGIGQRDSDVPVLEAVREGLEDDRVFLLPGNLPAAQVKGAIAQCSFFAGARTHSTIAALSSLVPTLSLAYSVKARGINEDIFGHQDFVLPVGAMDHRVLLDRTERLLAEASRIRSHLEERIPKLRALALGAGEHLAREVLHREPLTAEDVRS